MKLRTYKLNPFKELNIKKEEEARKKFIELFRNSTEDSKPILCLSFDMICNKSRYNLRNGIFIPKIKDEFYYTNIGDLNGLKNLMKIKKDKNLLNVGDKLSRTLLYLAARNGYIDIVKYLIKIGVDLNKTQDNGSTPLHGAAFYGNEEVVKLLIENGANPFIKNKFGNLAETEAYNDSIKQIIINSYNNPILKLYYNLYSKGKASHFIPIKSKIDDKIICYKIICKSNYNIHLKNNYEVVWHGTKYKNLESIVIKGLKPSGAKISSDSYILPPNGHIPLNTEFNGIENWANAVFFSPSYNYSSLPVYAEKIEYNNEKWACLVEGRVKKGKFTKHEPTTKFLRRCPSEPLLEYRVAVTEEDDCDTMFVTSVVFISNNFLKSEEENDEQSYNTISDIDDENMKLSQSFWYHNISKI